MAETIDTDAIRHWIGDERDSLYIADLQRFELCDEVDRLRALLAKALPWIDPNSRHEDYLLVREIEEALR